MDTLTIMMWLVLYAAAIARVSQLVTADAITAAPREWLTDRADRHRPTRPLATLINCDWCVTVWAAAAAAGLDAWAHGPLATKIADTYTVTGVGWAVVIAALALAAGMLATITR